MTNIEDLKMKIRQRVWRLLEEHGVARFPRPVYGRIPNFMGTDEAARRITGLKIWDAAYIVKANPDSPQKPLRFQALLHGKKVLMATPRLRNGFLLIDPSIIPKSRYSYASTIKGAFQYGRRLGLSEIPPVDLIVTGCVAVDRRGGRLGKGGGYAELEYAILRELGLADDDTPIVTTIHDLQLVEHIPLEDHDLTVDAAATPTRMLVFNKEKHRPKGIFWDRLGEKKTLGIIRELAALKGVRLD